MARSISHVLFSLVLCILLQDHIQALRQGASLSRSGLPSNKKYPLITSAEALTKSASDSVNAFFCTNDTLDARKVKGKILVCLRGVNSRVEKGVVAASLGAVGMILANNAGQVSVDPAELKFKEKGEKKEFRVSLTLKSKTENTTDFVYGSLTWTNHKNRVRSPIVVVLNSF
ncbi:Subtilisin-like protease [Vigna angularis]|uniref:Subtilisin-like protease n=1 Tax=Phaseolus angularis TaxID=3914 RepID=A0A8T0L8F0_PHAAN|nr:Subtilisin-like protease [Vigna angularis]